MGWLQWLLPNREPGRAVEDRKETPQGHEGVGGVSIGAWHWEDAMGTGRKI